MRIADNKNNPKMKPMFSIITAVYNTEKYVANCMRSVLNQKYGNFEYIVVNDGSTDDTLSIVESVAAKDERVHVITQDNKWVYAAMNRGIKEAQGDYILLVNADDLMHEDILQIAADRIIKYDYPDVIWTKVLVHNVDIDQHVILYNEGDLDGLVLTDEYYSNCQEVRDNWLGLHQKYITRNPHNIYKRGIMLAHPFREDFFGADYYFNSEIATELTTALLIKDVSVDVLKYKDNNMNISSGKYYDYEHCMYTKMIKKDIQNYTEWKMMTEEIKDYFYERRLKYFSTETRHLLMYNCPLTVSEKIRTIMEEYLDKTVWDMAMEVNRTEELDRRTVFGLKIVLENDSLPEDDKYAFIESLVNMVIEKEQPKEIILRNIICHELNPHHIGNEYYKSVFGVHVCSYN